MATEHVSITDPDIHEIKGAAAASANTLPVADGAGSHSWSKVGSSQINTSSIFNTNSYVLTCTLNDVSTASSVYIAFPFACTATKVTTVLQAAITGADSTVTIKSNGGSTIGTITVAQSGSAAGDVDTVSLTPTAFSADQRMQIDTDGASTNTAALVISIMVTRTA